jgi:hypothetical protein
MTYEELKKQATPGRLVSIHGKGTCFHDGNLDSLQRMIGRDGDQECWETVAEVWPTSKRTQAKADARILAHCFNHFDELLKALESAIAWIDDKDVYARDKLLAVIARAKEVKP